jgi:hypothetical protein
MSAIAAPSARAIAAGPPTGATAITRVGSVHHVSAISLGPMLASMTIGVPSSIASHRAQPPSSLTPANTASAARFASAKYSSRETRPRNSTRPPIPSRAAPRRRRSSSGPALANTSR